MVLIFNKIVFLSLSNKIGMCSYCARCKSLVRLCYTTPIESIFHVFGGFVKRFLGAHGKGKELRNGAFVVGVSIIAGSLTLIPAFGALGAVFTKVIAGGLYCGMMCYYYRKMKI